MLEYHPPLIGAVDRRLTPSAPATVFAASRSSGLYVGVAALALALLYGVSQAVSYAWLCDDAFISFRYASNLAAGKGLVYNAGEFIEGYSNFLWTVALALGIRLGVQPEALSQVLGIASFSAVGIVLGWFSWRRRADRQRLFLPLAACAFLIQRDAAVFATSGLETAFVTLLLTIAFVALAQARSRRSYLIAGTALGLAALTRMDTLVIAVGAVACQWLCHPDNRRPLLWLSAPVALLFAPYWLARFLAYGYIFPNTYYAKSASLSWWSQGWQYLALYVKTYPALALIPLVVIAVLVTATKRRSTAFTAQERASVNRTDRFPLWLALFMSLPYALLVIKVGGGFMFARLLIPVTPLALLALEEGSLELLRTRAIKIAGAVALIAALGVRVNQIHAYEHVSGIADEVNYYPNLRLQRFQDAGLALRPYFELSGASLAYYGGGAVLAYYANPRVALEAGTGLTDTAIAHGTITERGRPGHEKSATPDDLTARGIHLIFQQEQRFGLPDVKRRKLILASVPFLIHTYENSVMDKLRKMPDVEFVHFPSFLDSYVLNIDRVPTAQLAQNYERFHAYYFQHNDDAEREAHFLRELRRRRQPPSNQGGPTTQPITP